MHQDLFGNTASSGNVSSPGNLARPGTAASPRNTRSAAHSSTGLQALLPSPPPVTALRRESIATEDLPESLRAVINRRDTWLGRGDLQRDSTTTEAADAGAAAGAAGAANSDLHYHQNLPTGFAALDAKLCEQGWPLGTTIEVLSDATGMGAMGLFLPAMEKLSRQQRWQAFIAPPYTPYAPLLAARGIDTQQVLLVHPRDREEQLWSTEQALRSGTCSAVFCWLGHGEYRYAELRRLQLAAARGNTLAVLFRSQDMAHQHSPASLRLQMQAYREVHILKQRSGLQGINVYLPPEDDVPHQPQLWELPVEGPMTHSQKIAG
ncbi:MAG: translesion DNA synthesis-associated protein ImuA [Congregibacter sp.]